jgi:hypothetical protein
MANSKCWLLGYRAWIAANNRLKDVRRLAIVGLKNRLPSVGFNIGHPPLGKVWPNLTTKLIDRTPLPSGIDFFFNANGGGVNLGAPSENMGLEDESLASGALGQFGLGIYEIRQNDLALSNTLFDPAFRHNSHLATSPVIEQQAIGEVVVGY